MEVRRADTQPSLAQRERASTVALARLEAHYAVISGLVTLVVLGAATALIAPMAESLPVPADEAGTGLDLLLVGGLFALSAYNGLAYFPTRQLSYLVYGVMGAALTVVYATYFDLSAEMIGLQGSVRLGINHAATGASLALAMLFALAFLRVQRRRRRVASLAFGSAIAVLLFSISVLPALDQRVAEVIAAIPGLVFPPVVVALGIDAWRHGFRAARVYVLAWMPLIVAVLWAAGSVMAGDEEAVNGRVLALANLLEMLLLALALTDRVRLSMAARELAHSKEIDALESELARVRRLGPYTLGEKIGEGGMGSVFEASHALLRRPTAIKLIHPHVVGEEALLRFEREVRTTSRLTHPNTVTVYDYGRTEEGLLYYAMELLEGATARNAVEIDGPQPPARVVQVIHSVALALEEAHGVGLIHRDIKPGNIILAAQGGRHDVAKVVDFGLVKDVSPDAHDPELSTGAVLAGTPMYMAPELLEDPPRVLPSSDLYALGAVAYYMLSGEQVFTSGTVFQVMLRHMTEAPKPLLDKAPDVPEDVAALVMELLEKDARHRPGGAAEVARRAEECACFGEWTEDDARNWWLEHSEGVKQLQRPERSGVQRREDTTEPEVAPRPKKAQGGPSSSV